MSDRETQALNLLADLLAIRGDKNPNRETLAEHILWQEAIKLLRNEVQGSVTITPGTVK